MKKIGILLLVFLVSNHLFSQDTTTVYFTQNGVPTLPEFSTTYNKKYFSNGLWHKQVFATEGNVLRSDESASDSSFKTEEGIGHRYFPDGKIEKEDHYKNGLRLESVAYYENGKMHGEAFYKENGKLKKEEGWDENGTPIQPFIYEKEAEFPGGPSAWKDFLVKTLKNEVPKKNGAPINYIYHVVVSFEIDKEGNVTNVIALQNPGYGTAEEAVRVVKSSPKWEPAIQLNEKKIYRQRQRISFEVR